MFCLESYRLLLVMMAALAVAGPVRQSESPFSAADGARLQEKLSQIAENEGASDASLEPIVLYEYEVNAYLRFQAAPELPRTITEPSVSLAPGGGVTVRASVDLSAVSSERRRSLFDPLRYLTGRLLVAASGRLEARQGVGRVVVGSVTVGGIPVPASVLAELVRYYSRSDEQPNGIDLANPFELPYGVTEVRVEHEHAVVMQ